MADRDYNKPVACEVGPEVIMRSFGAMADRLRACLPAEKGHEACVQAKIEGAIDFCQAIDDALHGREQTGFASVLTLMFLETITQVAPSTQIVEFDTCDELAQFIADKEEDNPKVIRMNEVPKCVH